LFKLATITMEDLVVYVPGLAGGRILEIRHVETPGSNRRGGKCVRHDLYFGLDMLKMHVDLHQAMDNMVVI
jgi:hypothetical protein